MRVLPVEPHGVDARRIPVRSGSDRFARRGGDGGLLSAAWTGAAIAVHIGRWRGGRQSFAGRIGRPVGYGVGLAIGAEPSVRPHEGKFGIASPNESKIMNDR